MPDNTGDDEMGRSSAAKVLPAPEVRSWLADAMPQSQDAPTPEELAAVEIASGVSQTAETMRGQDMPNGFTYDGHTRGAAGMVEAQADALSAEVNSLNDEIKRIMDNAASLINMIEAHRDDAVERLSIKRDNAVKSATALKAMKQALGE